MAEVGFLLASPVMEDEDVAEVCVFVITSINCPIEIPFTLPLSTGDGSAGM